MKKVVGIFLAMILMVGFLGGCSPASKPEEKLVVNLGELMDAVKEEFGEDYAPNREIEMEEIENFTEIGPDDIEEFIAEGPMITVSIDTIMAFKAKEGKAEIVEEKLENYREFLVTDSFQYPMNLAKVNSAKVLRHGDYVFFLMLGSYDDREEATEEERLEFAQAEIKRAEDVINKFFE